MQPTYQKPCNDVPGSDLTNSHDVRSMQTKTLGGSLYVVTFISDHSRKVWATLKTKDQVFDVFKEFHAKIERETGK